MIALIRELLILLAFCLVWTAIATPATSQLIASKQWIKSEAWAGADFVARSRASRCLCYSMCLSILIGPRVPFPQNWLAIIVTAPTFFYLCWKVMVRFGQ